MKKITAILIVVVLIVLSVFSCSTNQSENDAFSNTSLNVSNASSNIYLEFSDSSINASNTSSDAPFDSYESSAPQSGAPDESVSDVFVPEESDAESSDESDYENSSGNESEDLSDASSDITSEPTHTCTFVKGKITEPTCTAQGYTLYTCSCGKAEKRDYTSVLGHSWSDWETIKESTTTSTGVEQRYCTRSGCDASETRELDKLPSDEDKYNVPATAENAHLVEERVLYYLNQYRISEGTAEATFLWNGKTYKYAKARAEQLVTNFAHDMDDIYAVATELEFGHYVAPFPDSYIDPDTGEIVYTGEMTEPYYSPGCSEAITKGYGQYGPIDDLAQAIATNIYASKTHWSYVGAETTQYITVGVYCLWNTWYICIATSSSDQYD